MKSAHCSKIVRTSLVGFGIAGMLSAVACSDAQDDPSSLAEALRRRHSSDALDAGAQAANCAEISTVGPTLVDASGNVWSLANSTDRGAVIRMNGAPAGISGNVTRLVFVNQTISQQNVVGDWWSWTNGDWLAESDPTGSCASSHPANDSGVGSPLPDAAVPPPAPTGGIVWGVNGHPNRQSYPLNQAESVFKIMSANGLFSYRIDVSDGDDDVFDTLIPLAAKYGMRIRPMLYPTSQAGAYRIAKKYAADIKIWEIGNELDGDRNSAQANINAMTTTYRGIVQASNETGAGLKTSINIMACNSNDLGGRCPNDTAGDLWFLDMAAATGFKFDYVTFHYYGHYGDTGYWNDLLLGQMRTAAAKYHVPIFLNETNCAEIYNGSTDGGHRGDGACYDGLANMLNEVKSKYSDIVQEVNLYELIDEPNNDGVEAHFGLMYDINNPKPNLGIISEVK